VYKRQTFHDPCYLGRQNQIVADPRVTLQNSGAQVVEMAQHGAKSFCCGAGGAQMWKEEEHGDERVSSHRFQQAQDTGAGTLALGCPFCMIMFNDAKKDASSDMEVLDIAEIVAKALQK
jgi:Fe-S oxidoreductase